MSSPFKYLFTPLSIGRVTLKNRIFQSGITQTYEDLFDNYALSGERSAAYYAERARGGAGLLIMGYQMVHPTSTGGIQRIPAAYRREGVARFRLIVDRVHEQGGVVFGQLAHTGMLADGEHIDDYHHVWSPSGIRGLAAAQTPKAMEPEDVRQVVAGFAESARHMKEGGLDGVEVHAAHGYLLAQFVSPVCNKRTDEYGGSLENRMRFLRETLAAIRREVGRDYPLGVRLSGDEFAVGGVTLDDTVEIVRRLEADGDLDYVNVSVGAFYGVLGSVSPMSIPPASYVYLAAAVKEAVRLPVFCIGRIADPLVAEQVLADGQADMVGMGRALICDPELPNKARAGRLEEIRHCMYCNQGCAHRVMTKGLALGCVQNPAAGREGRLGHGTLRPAGARKRVAVVGGGPAGLKAAEVLARRGHEVDLYEREQALGGMVRLAARLPTRQELEECIRYLSVQVESLGVRLHLGVEATAETVLRSRPDAVVVATGARDVRKVFSASRVAEVELPGFEQPNVLTIPEALGPDAYLGERVALVDDEGAQRTWGMAEWLADRGKRVVVVAERATAESPKLPLAWVDRFWLSRLAEKGVELRLSTEVQGLSGSTLRLRSRATGGESALEVDQVVLAGITVPDDALYFELKQLGLAVHRIGDCVAPRSLEFAIWEGEEVGRLL